MAIGPSKVATLFCLPCPKVILWFMHVYVSNKALLLCSKVMEGKNIEREARRGKIGDSGWETEEEDTD